MIYTLTLNPALDYVVNFDTFKLSETNRSSYDYIQYGGKGINVSKMLKELDTESICLGYLAGFTGEELERQVKEDLHLNTDFIKLSHGNTRINVKIRAEEETEIGGKGPQVSTDDLNKLYAQLDALQENDVLILSGSIPSGLSKEIYKDILEKLDGKHIQCVVDATGDLLLKTLAYHPYLIKPNRKELEELFDVSLNTMDEIEIYARKLKDLGAQNVIVSCDKDGSLYIDEEDKCYTLGVCIGNLVNSVGAGDSMVAGFVAGKQKGLSSLDTLKLATASGGATAFSEGIGTKELVNELLKQL